MQSEMDIVRRYTSDNGADLEAIFSVLGIEFKKEDLGNDVSGSLSFDGEKYCVKVNSTDIPLRQRFSAAHELAHYLMHRHLLSNGDTLHRDRLFGAAAKGTPAAPFRPIHEVQANKLAAEILMPSERLADRYDQAKDNTAELARSYQVSPAAMKIRLKNLGLRASAD